MKLLPAVAIGVSVLALNTLESMVFYNLGAGKPVFTLPAPKTIGILLLVGLAMSFAVGLITDLLKNLVD